MPLQLTAEIIRRASLILVVAAQFAVAAPLRADDGAAPVAQDHDAKVGGLRELLEILEDDAEREQLLVRLRTLLDAHEALRHGQQQSRDSAGGIDLVLGGIGDRLEAGASRLRETAELMLDIPSLWSGLLEQAVDPQIRARWIETLAKIALVLFAGLAVQMLTERLLRRYSGKHESPLPSGPAVLLALLVRRLFVDLIPLVLFGAAALGLLLLLDPAAATRIVALCIVGAWVLERMVSRVAALLLLRPERESALFALTHESATYLYVWVRRFAIVLIYGYFVDRAAVLLSAPAPLEVLFSGVIGALAAGMLIVFILQNRGPVADRIRGPAVAGASMTMRGLRRFLAETWAPIAIIYVISAFGIWLAGIEGGFSYLVRATVLTVIIAGAAGVVRGSVAAGLERMFRVRADLKDRYPDLEQRVNRYLPMLHGIAAALVYVLAAFAVLDAWGVGIFSWLAGESGRVLVATTARVVTILLVALVVWETLSFLINRYLERHDSETGELIEASARARTLLPLFHKVLLVAVVLIAGLTVLAEIGINITPLLAGAGVAGLAIGFGAQSLVKDVISGTFILLEDSIAVGDVVDVGGHLGVVEGLSIRTIRLRDAEGIVHTVPFGAVSGIRNMSKEFSYAVMIIGVAYREDVDAVFRILQETAAEMQQDAEFGPMILEPLEVQGLDSFGDSAVNIRVRFKTEPGKQWGVRREFNRRVKYAFDRRGIEIPFPHRTIYFGVDQSGSAPPARIRMEPGEG
jgi:small-conductance mechanosensitive channel